jgi:translation initiation factor 4B
VASDRPSQADGAIDWRSSRLARPAEPEGPPIKRKSLFTTESQPSVADKEHTWTVGSKFKPAPPLSPDDGFVTRMGSLRGRGEMGPPKDPTSITDDSDWRRSRPVPRNNTSRAFYSSR